MTKPFSGHLYQLESKSKLHSGAYVAINGPHDAFGVVCKSEPAKEGGGYLNLIRGVKQRSNEKVIANF